MIYLGIDPDVKESGFAVVKNGTRTSGGILEFFGLLETIDYIAKGDYMIIIEAGWLNKKPNWHPSKNSDPRKESAIAQRIASKVGANAQIGKLIVEYCERNGFNYQLVRPTTSKVPKKILEKELGIKIKNQDEADAIMLVKKYIKKQPSRVNYDKELPCRIER